MKKRKRGRSWREEKRDGPEEKKRGTVLKRRKRGRSWREEKMGGLFKKLKFEKINMKILKKDVVYCRKKM